MTASERWDAMTDHERIEWLGVNVMGWHHDYRASQTHASYWRKDGHIEAGEEWNPITDAAADYLVLAKVRETWLSPNINHWSDALSGLWWSRYMDGEGRAIDIKDDEFAENDGSWLALYYEPGDYSRVAYLTMTEQTP